MFIISFTGSPALQVDSLPTELWGKPYLIYTTNLQHNSDFLSLNDEKLRPGETKHLPQGLRDRKE